MKRVHPVEDMYMSQVVCTSFIKRAVQFYSLFRANLRYSGLAM